VSPTPLGRELVQVILTEFIPQHMLVQIHQRVGRLILTGGAEPSRDRQMRQVRLDLALGQFPGMPPAATVAMKPQEIAHPRLTALDRSRRQVSPFAYRMHPFEQFHGSSSASFGEANNASSILAGQGAHDIFSEELRTDPGMVSGYTRNIIIVRRHGHLRGEV
jgi:hypothetical protein